MTCADLSNETFNKYLSRDVIKEKRGYHDLKQSANINKSNICEEDLFENLEEKVLNVTQLDLSTSPENIPLPNDAEEEWNETLNKERVFLETVAEIHATMAGDQKILSSENNSLAPSVKDAGEFKVARPVPDPEPLEKLQIINEVKQSKNKVGLRTRLKSFFTKTPRQSQTIIF